LVHDRSLVKKRFLRCRNAHYQERRASARRGSVNAIAGTLPENRGDCRQCAHKRRCNLGSGPTGGLRPPLLIAARSFAGEKTIFAMQERTLPGAAGVRPPWFRETAFATATVYRGESTFRPWTWLARATIENRNRSAAIVGQQERRASARRGRDKRSGAEKRIRRAWRASESGAAGVSPPWFGKRNCRNASGKSGRLPAVCSQTWFSLGSGHTGANAPRS
jgi:hypothetical protein